jgi:hypothetical protein
MLGVGIGEAADMPVAEGGASAFLSHPFMSMTSHLRAPSYSQVTG